MNNILFLPVDFNLPEKLEFPTLENTRTNVVGASFWDYEQLLDNKIIGEKPWREDLDPIRRRYKEIISELPFETLENVRLSIQSKFVKPHIDISEETKKQSLENYNHYLSNEPCGYRIVISGGEESLKLIVDNNVITTKLPSIPSVYLLNSTRCLHFIENDIGRKTVYIRGKVDPLSHKKLIERSLKKFKNYAIFSN